MHEVVHCTSMYTFNIIDAELYLWWCHLSFIIECMYRAEAHSCLRLAKNARKACYTCHCNVFKAKLIVL